MVRVDPHEGPQPGPFRPDALAVRVDYRSLRERAVGSRLGAEAILVADVDDLVAMKLRAGRPIDLQDIAAITAHERG